MVWGNCVFAPVLNPNCDFTPILFHFAFLPLLFGKKPRFTPTPSTSHKSVKEDNFALANISLIFLELCEYTLVCHYISVPFQ